MVKNKSLVLFVVLLSLTTSVFGSVLTSIVDIVGHGKNCAELVGDNLCIRLGFGKVYVGSIDKVLASATTTLITGGLTYYLANHLAKKLNQRKAYQHEIQADETQVDIAAQEDYSAYDVLGAACCIYLAKEAINSARETTNFTANYLINTPSYLMRN